MIYKVYSVFDIVTGEYLSPVLHKSDDEAIRSFDSSIQTSFARREGMLFSHKDDFELRYIADFDSEIGLLTPCSAGFVLLVRGSDFNYGKDFKCSD